MGNQQLFHGDSWSWISSVVTNKQTLQLPLRSPTVAVTSAYPLRTQGTFPQRCSPKCDKNSAYRTLSHPLHLGSKLFSVNWSKTSGSSMTMEMCLGSLHLPALLHPSQASLLSLAQILGPSAILTHSHLGKLCGNRKEFCIN